MQWLMRTMGRETVILRGNEKLLGNMITTVYLPNYQTMHLRQIFICKLYFNKAELQNTTNHVGM